MQSYTAQTAAPAAVSSLIKDGVQVADRLQEILGRVRNIADHLHGPHPRDASEKGAPEPVPSVRRNVDKANSLAELIEIELSDVERLI